ncbi:MAG: GrpB family protein [Lapillicoccus sp.]
MTRADKYPAVRLVPYDPGWEDRYVEISTALMDFLGPGWVVEHVGSTSVPGLLAKPVIDLAVGMPEGAFLSDASGPFLRAGWTDPEAVGNHRAAHLVIDSLRAGIAHIFDASQWPDAHPRLFAEWLRTHEDERDRYASLKYSLVSQGMWGSDYTEAKTAFVLEVVNRARVARSLPPVSGPL